MARNDESILAGWERFLSEPREPKARLHCDYCDMPLMQGMTAFELNNEIICPRCAKQEYNAGLPNEERFCSVCGEPLTDDDDAFLVNGKIYCEDCFDEEYSFTAEA